MFPHPNVLVAFRPRQAHEQGIYVHPQHAEQEGMSFVFWLWVVLIVAGESDLDGAGSHS